MAGLAPQSVRIKQAEDVSASEPVIVDLAEDSPHQDIDDDGNILRISYPDGSVTVSLDGKGLGNVNEPEVPEGWFENLAEKLPNDELGRIANDLIRGISDDDQSRREWVEARKTGIQLLGLKIEVPGLEGAEDGAPVEGMSKVRSSLLLEAVLRFQANARSELLPTDGPVKLRNDDNNADLAEDLVANALEKDLNHYLTSTASEYYPDTDRMLLLLGFGGTTFKKVYFCPLRNRPVSETVNADDLIVSAQATDLQNARRVTHRVMMTPSTVKRMQILGVYRDIDLSTPGPAKMDDVQREKAAQQGVNPDSQNPLDRDREIYECYCELDISGYEHKLNGKATGLEIPYRVTIDVTTQQVLSIVRNYNKSGQLPEKRTTFVKYTYIPGLGFYDIGLLHILGNTTNAITAATREMLDNGMFANFPGFLIADQGLRQNTNIFRVPPGGGAPVKTGGMPIRDAIFPLPYNTQQMGPLMELVSALEQQGQRVGSTSEVPVGEGRADVPVGTILAMIDMATKITGSVHKRMHAAQAEEFRLLVNCFREHPEAFWQRNSKPAYQWDEATFLQALNDYDLTPQADPNTASHTQRVMKVMGLKQLQAASPDLYDPVAIDTAALQTLGWSNPQQFFAKPDQQQQKPEIIKGEADIKANQTRADAAMLNAQANAEKVKLEAQKGLQPQQQEDTPVDVMEAQTKKEALGLDAQRLHFDKQRVAAELAADHEAQQADHHMEVLRLAAEVLQRGGADPGHEAREIDKATE